MCSTRIGSTTNAVATFTVAKSVPLRSRSSCVRLDLADVDGVERSAASPGIACAGQRASQARPENRPAAGTPPARQPGARVAAPGVARSVWSSSPMMRLASAISSTSWSSVASRGSPSDSSVRVERRGEAARGRPRPPPAPAAPPGRAASARTSSELTPHARERQARGDALGHAERHAHAGERARPARHDQSGQIARRTRRRAPAQLRLRPAAASSARGRPATSSRRGPAAPSNSATLAMLVEVSSASSSGDSSRSRCDRRAATRSSRRGELDAPRRRRPQLEKRSSVPPSRRSSGSRSAHSTAVTPSPNRCSSRLSQQLWLDRARAGTGRRGTAGAGRCTGSRSRTTGC